MVSYTITLLELATNLRKKKLGDPKGLNLQDYKHLSTPPCPKQKSPTFLLMLMMIFYPLFFSV